MKKYLQASTYIDWETPSVKGKAQALRFLLSPEAKPCYLKSGQSHWALWLMY